MWRSSKYLILGMWLVAGVGALTIVSIGPPAARGAGAAPTDFSASRARVHVEAIGRVPHPIGSPAHEDVRTYLMRTLADLGLEPRVLESRAALRVAGIIHAARVKNVMARLKGTHSGPAVLLAAHYDSVPQSRGASDDASGVAALLETARALLAGPPMANDVIFLFTDGEEVAGAGSLAFTEDELTRQPIGVALNFEARGTGGAVALYDTSENNGALIRALDAAVPRVVSSSLLGSLARALPNDSDATLFKRAGIPTYAFAYVDGVYRYHQYTDDADALDLRSLQHDGDYALPLVRYFGDRAAPAPAASVTYFDVFGRGVVSYSRLVTRALGLGTLLLFGGLFWQARRASDFSTRSIAAFSLVAFAATVLAGLAAGLSHLALRAWVGAFVLSASPWLATYVGVFVGIAVLSFCYSMLARKDRALSAVLGALVPWGVFLLLTSIFVPASSFVFQWPLMFALLGAYAWMRLRDQPGAALDLSVTMTLVPAAFFWGYIQYTLFVMVGSVAPEAVAVAAALPCLLASPLVARVSARHLKLVGAGLVAAGIFMGLFGGLGVRKSPGLSRPDSLVYKLDAARNVAKWAADDVSHDAFVAQRVPLGQRFARADAYNLPRLDIQATSIDDGELRHATLHLASPRAARCIKLWELTPERLVDVRIDDKSVVDVIRFSPEMDERLLRFFTGGAAASAWVMEYCGADVSGFKLEVSWPRGRPVKLRVIEYADGLPGPPLRARTSSDGYPSIESDVTMTTTDVKL